MWYGYTIEAIYTVLGTVLIAAVAGILIYHWPAPLRQAEQRGTLQIEYALGIVFTAPRRRGRGC